MKDRSHLLTEQRLPESMRLDTLSIERAVELMNQQDLRAVQAVGHVQAQIAQGVEMIVAAFRSGGRVFYVGAGTSGRLGMLDAAECPPTFRSDPELVQGIMAGGNDAMFQSREGAEDQPEGGEAEMDRRNITARDVVVGIAAGGTTPFVHGALRKARQHGAKTIFITCVQPVDNEPKVDLAIRPLVGPEVLTGSTRLKAGTATKLVLNTLTTVAMVQVGKVYENLMVDLRASNTKLWDRGARIVSTLTGLSRDKAMELLQQAGGHVKLAVVMHKRSVSADEGQHLLDLAGGMLRKALEG